MENEKQNVTLNAELTDSESKAYEDWKATNVPPLPVAKALKLYELFLNFYSCDEIYRINAQKISLGAIIDCRLRYDWDKRRKEKLESLYNNVEQKVVKVKNEALVHLTDLLSAAHKIWGDKIKQFLQDGDETVLGDINIVNFKNYKELITLLRDLTEKKESSVSKVVVDHTHSIKSGNDLPKMSSGVAADLLKLLKENDTEKV